MAVSVPKKTTQKLGDQEIVNVFDETLLVASLATSIIVSYTVPVGKTFFLLLAEFGGNNIASYEVFINNVKEGKKDTNFGGSFSDEIYFGHKKVLGGETVKIEVENFRSEVGDFFGRILGALE